MKIMIDTTRDSYAEWTLAKELIEEAMYLEHRPHSTRDPSPICDRIIATAAKKCIQITPDNPDRITVPINQPTQYSTTVPITLVTLTEGDFK